MIAPEDLERIGKRPAHLVIGGSLDGTWIEDSVAVPSQLDGAAAKVEPTTKETWRAVRFRLGRATERHVWILRGMTEAQAFDRLLGAYKARME